MIGKETIKMRKLREKLKWKRRTFISFSQKNSSIILRKERNPAIGGGDRGSEENDGEELYNAKAGAYTYL